MLSSMRYKTFVWPHNPRVYSIRFERSMALQKIPFGRYHLQGLGLTRRVMRGEGEFFGENAYRQFKELASLFYEDTPGTLIHPLWDTASAWFVKLELEQEPRADYVKYSFEFWEDFRSRSRSRSGTQTGLELLSSPTSGGTVSNPSVSGGGTASDPSASSGGADPSTSGGGTVSDPSSSDSGTGGTGGMGKTSEAGARWHTVVKGETMWGISQRYGVGLSTLIALNPQIKNPNLIYIGQKVRVA